MYSDVLGEVWTTQIQRYYTEMQMPFDARFVAGHLTTSDTTNDENFVKMIRYPFENFRPMQAMT